jgi:putative SOS response-associated peptidase YedK
MPVILSTNDYDLWLDPEIKDTSRVALLLDQYPADRMSVRPVSTYVNNARNEGPNCCLNSA